MKILLSLLVGYLIGSINPAYIICKLKGFDIRTRGTMNAGASNIKLQLGWTYFFIVAIFDISKSIIAAITAKYLFKVGINWQIVAGCFAILGHMYPFYLQFRGGKGFASYIGLSLFFNFKIIAIIMIVAVVISLISNYIVAATTILCISVPVVACVTDQPYEVIAMVSLISFIILYKHRVNYIRFLKKEDIGINGKKVGLNILKK